MGVVSSKWSDRASPRAVCMFETSLLTDVITPLLGTTPSVPPKLLASGGEMIIVMIVIMIIIRRRRIVIMIVMILIIIIVIIIVTLGLGRLVEQRRGRAGRPARPRQRPAGDARAYTCVYIYIYICVGLRERGSAPKRGRHSTILFSTRCICAVAA